VTPLMAAICIYAAPLVVLFFFAQKYIIQGVVTSGLKG
jgi:ABC-type glycerol-3-phosphate transport system permease component